MSKQEMAIIGLDKRKNSDLEKLKDFGGPLTKPEDIDVFVGSKISDTIKEQLSPSSIRKRYQLVASKVVNLIQIKAKIQKLTDFNIPAKSKDVLFKSYLYCECNVVRF